MDKMYKFFNRTVKQHYGSKPQIPPQQELLEIAETLKLLPEKTKFGIYKTPVGIEVELENLRDLSNAPFWNVVADHSLRNNGAEFVSVPVSGKNIDAALASLRNILEKNMGYETSVRCSTHVHINVSDLDRGQLHMLIALYACFEKLLFSLHDERRIHNPYCYPLTYLRNINTITARNNLEYMKYCALNTGHLSDYGTVEFRHMEGLESVEKLERWIQIIQKLVQYVKLNDIQYVYSRIMDLNTSSEYASFAEQVLYPVNPFRGITNLQEEMESGVTWAKLFLHFGE